MYCTYLTDLSAAAFYKILKTRENLITPVVEEIFFENVCVESWRMIAKHTRYKFEWQGIYHKHK